MRRFPSSWNATLTALGFRKKSKKSVSRKTHRLEQLEAREMFAADSVSPQLVAPEYVIVGGTGQQYFDLQPAAEGQPAVLAMREGASAPVDEKLTVLIEKRLGDFATERVEVVVDLVEQGFLERFYADRVGQSVEIASANEPEPAEPIGPILPGDGPAAAISASFSAFAVAAPPASTLEELLQEAALLNNH